MGKWVLNERGFYNRGSGRPPYQPVAQKASAKINQPIGLKERYQSAVRAKIRKQMQVTAAEEQWGPVPAIERDVGDWLNQVQRSSGTVQGAEEYVNQRLRQVGGRLMPNQVRATAQRMLQIGIATTPRQATKKAIAEELSMRIVEKVSGRQLQPSCEPLTLPGGGLSGLGASVGPVTAGGTSFAEWFGQQSARAGVFGKVMNTWADWTCSPADTAVGAAIVGIWTGPAGAAAVAEGATEAKSMAGCDLWALGAKLKTQLATEGVAVTREQAMQLITSGAYAFDNESGRFVKSNTFAGWWLMVRPFVPYLGLALALWLVVKVTT